MPPISTDCHLCGRPNPPTAVTLTVPGGDAVFCCIGCRQVYRILMETTGSEDPVAFRQTDVYRQCQALGIIPGDGEAAPPASAPRPPADTAVGGISMTLHIGGMYCMACAWVIEEALYRLAGVLQVDCRFAMDRLHCRYDPARIDPERIAEQIRSIGYRPSPLERANHSGERRRLFIRFVLSAFFTMNVMMLSAALYSGFVTNQDLDAVRSIGWPMVILATLVVGVGGWPILNRAVMGLLHGITGMDTLVAMGAVSAYGFSLHQFWAGSIHVYFDTACMLVSLVLLGKWLERRALDIVAADVDSLMASAPTKVRICTPADPQGRYAPLESLRMGDRFRVEAGEGIAADGRVAEGRAAVDESALTGESRPVAKTVGDSLTSGTSLLSGAVTIRADAVGDQSIMGQTRAVIDAALARKSPAEINTDRWLRRLVPAIIGLAAVTGIGYGWAGYPTATAVIRAVTVLVIACPCALGVAIPLARVAGLALAGRQGILVRRFETFADIGRIDRMVIDKTGTLTLGRWSLTGITTAADMDSAAVLAWAAALEADLDHPVALALIEAAIRRSISIPSAEARCGHAQGVTGTVAGRRIRIGTRSFAACGEASWHRPRGKDALESRVFMTVDGCPAAVFRFADTIRPGAGHLVSILANRGVGVVLVSGDTTNVTRAVGRRIGIADCRGDLSPQAKQAVVTALQTQGHRVAVVGDGINDAPALAAADLGVAVRGPGPVMADAADAVFMAGDPGQWPAFVELAGRVMGTIRWNLIGALAYNLVAIPVAMAGWLSPPVAVAAMLVSSLSVIANTLRLVRRRPIHGTYHEPVQFRSH